MVALTRTSVLSWIKYAHEEEVFGPRWLSVLDVAAKRQYNHVLIYKSHLVAERL